MTEPEVLDWELLRRFPLPEHPEDSDKEGRGRVLVIAGSRELAGAAYLAGIGGLRAGAGKLQIVTAASISGNLGIAIPEARVIGLEETDEGCLAASAVEPILVVLLEPEPEEAEARLEQQVRLDGAEVERLLVVLHRPT